MRRRMLRSGIPQQHLKSPWAAEHATAHRRRRRLITISNRPGPDKRQRFTYSLTTRGAAEKVRLTDQFLARKLAEYNALHAELTGSASGLPPIKHRTNPMQSNLAPIPELYVSYESAQS